MSDPEDRSKFQECAAQAFGFECLPADRSWNFYKAQLLNAFDKYNAQLNKAHFPTG